MVIVWCNDIELHAHIVNHAISRSCCLPPCHYVDVNMLRVLPLSRFDMVVELVVKLKLFLLQRFSSRLSALQRATFGVLRSITTTTSTETLSVFGAWRETRQTPQKEMQDRLFVVTCCVVACLVNISNAANELAYICIVMSVGRLVVMSLQNVYF